MAGHRRDQPRDRGDRRGHPQDLPGADELTVDRRAADLARLGELKREVAALEDALGLREARQLPQIVVETGAAAYALFAEHGTDFLSIHAANGDYLFASPNVERMFGWTPAELIGRNAYELFHPDDLTRIASNHARHVDCGATRVRYRLRCANGAWRWVESSSRATHHPDGAIAQILGFTRDVHDEERTRDAVLVAERTAALGRLAAAIGHELANPLAAAWISAEYLKRRAAAQEADILRALLSSLQRAADVLSELRILGESPAASPVELDLGPAASRIARLIGVPTGELAAAPLRADPARLHQMVFHVLHVHGESAAVTTGADGDEVWIRVSSDAAEPLTALRADLLSAIRGEHRSERSTTRLVEALVAELGGTVTRAEHDGRLETRIALPRLR